MYISATVVVNVITIMHRPTLVCRQTKGEGVPVLRQAMAAFLLNIATYSSQTLNEVYQVKLRNSGLPL